MDDETFERILDAGSELYQCLDSVLSKQGLDPTHAGSVAIVVLAGLIKAGATTPGKTVDGAAMVAEMWHRDETSGTLLEMRFAPPHREAN